jgi:hypothetical protein
VQQHEPTRQDDLHFTRQVNAFFNAMARSLEQQAPSQAPLFQKDLQELYLELQKISFELRADYGRLRSSSDFKNANSKVAAAMDGLYEKIKDHPASRLKVRIPRYPFRRVARYSYFHPELHDESNARLTLIEVIDYLNHSFRAAETGQPFLVLEAEVSTGEDIESVKKSIPSQKVAPAQFDIIDGKLTVVDQNSKEKPDSSASIDASAEALVENKDSIISDLQSSNCDKRLLQQIEKLGEILESKKNIVRLGMENMNTRIMASSFSDELPDYLSAKIDALSSGIAMYVAQFTDWQIFIQNAAEAIIEDGFSQTIAASADNVIQEVTVHSAVIDESVPRTLNFLKVMAADPATTSKRVFFALIRTFENLVISSFKYVIDLAEKTADKASDKISDGLSSMLARSLTAIGLSAALMLMPVSLQVRGLEWVQSTYQFVKENIAPLTGVF